MKVNESQGGRKDWSVLGDGDKRVNKMGGLGGWLSEKETLVVVTAQ